MNKGGVHLRGEVGELWLYGCKAGLVYRWRLEGYEYNWELRAERYKIDPLLWREGKREIDLVLEVAGYEFRAKGASVWTEVHADGHTHPAIIIKGRKGLRICQPKAGPVARATT